MEYITKQEREQYKEIAAKILTILADETVTIAQTERILEMVKILISESTQFQIFRYSQN